MKATLTFNLKDLPDETQMSSITLDMDNPDHRRLVESLAGAKLEFDLDDYCDSDDRSEFTRAVKASHAYGAIWDIAQDVFRPARKHGYNDKKIEDLITKAGTHKDDPEWPEIESSVGADLIQELEQKFYKILSDHNINLDEEYT